MLKSPKSSLQIELQEKGQKNSGLNVFCKPHPVVLKPLEGLPTSLFYTMGSRLSSPGKIIGL